MCDARAGLAAERDQQRDRVVLGRGRARREIRRVARADRRRRARRGRSDGRPAPRARAAARRAAARIGIAARRSASPTRRTRRRPTATRKHLKPRTPAATQRARARRRCPARRRPRTRRRRAHWPRAAARFAVERRHASSSPGSLLSGMSTSVVTPPAAAARVAVAKPSHSVRPGSLRCTCVSTMPGHDHELPQSTMPRRRRDRPRRQSRRCVPPSDVDDAADCPPVARRARAERSAIYAAPSRARTRGGDSPPRAGGTRRSNGCRRSARSRRQSVRCASAIDAPDGERRLVSGAAARPSARRCRTRCAAPSRPVRTPAITTFEIACAARVPTFRNHCRPSIARNLDARRSARRRAGPSPIAV